MSFGKVFEAIMRADDPDWQPPTAEELAERGRQRAREERLKMVWHYYDLRQTVRANSENGVVEYVLCRKQGSNRSGADRAGYIYHAVAGGVYNGWAEAICGTAPQGRSGGWSDEAPAGAGVTCKRCAAALARDGRRQGENEREKGK